METLNKNEYLKQCAEFLTSDGWSETRILELLSNVWLDGYNEANKEKENK
mgnify:CR=1 FL=1